MPRATSPAPAAEGVEPASPAPDWDNVPFDVGCARCGHDLRGQTDPKCPACGLEFDWQDAVPIERLICLHCDYHLYGLQETRCPECGEPFTWDEVLAEYHRRRKPLFEYRWREEPVRSLFRTWYRALRPGKFWRTIDIHDPPQVKPLWVMTVIALGIFTVSVPVCIGTGAWLAEQLWRLRSRGSPGGSSGLLTSIIVCLLEPSFYKPALVVIAWCGFSGASLMIFQQSMRLCRVRAAHVMRVWTYAITIIVPVAFACIAPCVWIFIAIPRWEKIMGYAFLALLVGFVVFVTWSIRQGYRHYIRMPHSLAVAMASQIIAVLAIVTATVIVRLFL